MAEDIDIEEIKHKIAIKEQSRFELIKEYVAFFDEWDAEQSKCRVRDIMSLRVEINELREELKKYGKTRENITWLFSFLHW